MLDPLGISAGIVTLINATHAAVTICYKSAAAAKGASLALSKVIDELNSLRQVLESIERLSRTGDDSDPATVRRLEHIRQYSDLEHSPIAKELKFLIEKIRPAKWAGRNGSRRKVLVHSLTWPLKESETRRTLENIGRLKSTLQLDMTTDHLAVSLAIRDTQREGFQSVNLALDDIRAVLSRSTLASRIDDHYPETLRWLSAPDPSINYDAALKARHVNTGLWLLESEEYRAWKVARGSFLWLHGGPGRGKNILSSTIIEDLRREASRSNRVIVYFYFQINDGAKRYVDKMLRSLIVQLLSGLPSVPGSLKFLFQICSESERQPQSRELEVLLIYLVESYEKTFVVLDALDECVSQQELLDLLKKAMEWRSPKLHAIMMSRSWKDFVVFFGARLGGGSSLSIEDKIVDEDCSL